VIDDEIKSVIHKDLLAQKPEIEAEILELIQETQITLRAMTEYELLSLWGRPSLAKGFRILVRRELKNRGIHTA
jgi:hypothetical protein